MAEEQRATEELYEKRIDILTKSVKKARKRPRIERVEDDDDEWISSVFLHKEEVKNKVFVKTHCNYYTNFAGKQDILSTLSRFVPLISINFPP